MRLPARPAIILGCGLAWLSWFRWHTGIALEDALITWRYAANLASGLGFVFNPGEPVLGTTTPLLTLLLSAAGTIFGVQAIPAAAAVLMIAAMLAAGLMTRQALLALGRPAWAADLSMALVLFHPETLWSATGGMETPLVLFLMAASLAAAACGRLRLAGLAAGLLVLARADGAIWAACILAICALEGWRSFLRAASMAALVAAPWLLFATFQFGSPIPHTILAKRVIGTTGAALDAGRLQEFLLWSSRFFGAVAPGLRVAGIGCYLAACVLLWRSGNRLLRLLALYPVLFAAALYLGGTPLYFDWYLLPLSFICLAACAAALPAADRIPAWLRVAVGLALALLFARQGAAMADYHRGYQENETELRRGVGLWLRDNTPPEASVAMEAIGYQGYYSGRRVIDLAGLVSPGVLRLRQESGTAGAAFRRILEELRPDYVVLRSFEVDLNRHFHGGPLFETERDRGAFATRYREVRRFAAPRLDLWGETGHLTLYARREGT